MRVKAFFGGILMVVGALTMLFSGGCSLFLLASTFNQGGGSSIIPLVLIIGGIPFLVGLGFFSSGKILMRCNDESK